jgi:hypothetical protein
VKVLREPAEKTGSHAMTTNFKVTGSCNYYKIVANGRFLVSKQQNFFQQKKSFHI